MKNMSFLILIVLCAFRALAQDPNIIVDMNGPTYGIGIKTNFPGYKGTWARGYFVNNESGSSNLFGFGGLGQSLNGTSSLIKGWIGKNWSESYMNFLPNGNVGIGTEVPAEKLSVNGRIRAQEVKVETANWPDYVFDEDYKILGLNELGAYIKANKHLPDVPSAAVLEKEGLPLGEMNRLLMKKIEELTLYLIEKEDQIKIEKQTNSDQQELIVSIKKQLDLVNQRLNVMEKK